MTHYDTTYFDWQKGMGQFGGWADLFKFQPYVGPTDAVLDFGCGGGFLLANLRCSRRIGVEVIAAARSQAQGLGLEVFADLDNVPPGQADLVISHHALEHVGDPLAQVAKMKRVLRPAGRLVLVVPHDAIGAPYKPHDMNQHLYTWNRQTLANLAAQAGFVVDSVDLIRHTWPPHFVALRRALGAAGFHAACRVYSRLTRTYQVRLAAHLP